MHNSISISKVYKKKYFWNVPTTFNPILLLFIVLLLPSILILIFAANKNRFMFQVIHNRNMIFDNEEINLETFLNHCQKETYITDKPEDHKLIVYNLSNIHINNSESNLVLHHNTMTNLGYTKDQIFDNNYNKFIGRCVALTDTINFSHEAIISNIYKFSQHLFIINIKPGDSGVVIEDLANNNYRDDFYTHIIAVLDIDVKRLRFVFSLNRDIQTKSAINMAYNNTADRYNSHFMIKTQSLLKAMEIMSDSNNINKCVDIVLHKLNNNNNYLANIQWQ